MVKGPRWVIGVSLAATAVLAAFACRVYYDHNLLHLQAAGLDSVQWELKLIDHTAGASWHSLDYEGVARTVTRCWSPTWEGALLLAWVTQDTGPVSLTAEAMAHLIESETAVLDS